MFIRECSKRKSYEATKKRYCQHCSNFAHSNGITLGTRAVLLTFKISISPEKEVRSRPIKWGVSEPSFKNYQDILFSSSKAIGTAYTFKRGLINSLIVSVITTVITVFFGALGAYAIARLKVKYGNAMTFFVLLTQMLPPVLLIIPLYFIANQFKLLNTKLLLVICYVALNLPLCIWIMRGYFLTLPSAIEESALIDGCDRLSALFRLCCRCQGQLSYGGLLCLMPHGTNFCADVHD